MVLLMQRPLAIEPVEMEDFGAPDVFAHGWAMDYGPEVITGISYVERIERGVIRRQVVVRTHYPRSRWMAALNTTLVGVRGGEVH